MKDIIQIMPAPGWRVIFVYRPAHLQNGKTVWDDHDEILFEDMPIVGWGVVHVHDEDGEEDYNEVDLLFLEEESGLVESVKEFFGSVVGGIHHVLPPGRELTEELKAQWSDELNRKLEQSAKRAYGLAA